MPVNRHAGAILNRLSREPVLIGAAILASVQIADPSPVVLAAATAWVALLQRMFSTSAKSADERVEVARYVGAVEAQAPTAPPVTGP